MRNPLGPARLVKLLREWGSPFGGGCANRPYPSPWQSSFSPTCRSHGQERNRFRQPLPSTVRVGLSLPPSALQPTNENNMTQQVSSESSRRWRSEVTEALSTVRQEFGVSPESLPREALIAALTDAIWAQRAAYARMRETLVVQTELADESM